MGKKMMMLLLTLCLLLAGCGSEPEPETLPAPAMEWEHSVGNVVQIATSGDHVAVLRTDGTVAALGDNEKGQCDVSGWRGIVKVYAVDGCTIGLRADGTVAATGFEACGWTDVQEICSGMYGPVLGLTCQGNVLVPDTEDEDLLEVRNWTDIRELLVDTNGIIYGLKNDGTVVFAGLHHDAFYDSCAHCIIPTWTGVEKIFAYDYYLAAVLGDGTVVSSCPEVLDVKGWTNLESAVVTYPVYFGISEEGQLLTEGMLGIWTDDLFFYSQDHLFPELQVKKMDLSDFTDLQQLVAWSPGGYLFGLKTDGSLAQFPRNTLDPNAWQGITQLVSGYDFVAAVRRDGRALAWSYTENCPDVSTWENIVEIHSIYVDDQNQLLGLRSDGTLVGTGELANWYLAGLTN